MKLTSLQENLKSGLTVVSHIAGKNVNLPILNNVMIEARDGNIKFITTDLEIGIVATVRGKVDEEGVFTVDAKVLSEYVSLLPNKKVEIKQKDLKMSVSSENYHTTIKGQGADDFPLIPKVDKESYYKVGVDEFKEALSSVVFAVSTAETRIELSGVYFDLSSDKLILVATDSYRLAERNIKISTNGSAGKRIIVPAKTIQELIRLLSAMKSESVSEDKQEVEIYVSENQILFVVGSVELISRLIEGQYPDYQQIIPANSETKVLLNKAEMTRAVKASAIFSKTGINDINLDFPASKNKLTITSESSQVGENTAELEAKLSGKDNGIVVNYRYLLDGLNNIESENIKLEVIDSSTPCILKSDKDDGYLYIIMPIKQ
jgi:DNA polymerase-3 subunit beta